MVPGSHQDNLQSVWDGGEEHLEAAWENPDHGQQQVGDWGSSSSSSDEVDG